MTIDQLAILFAVLTGLDVLTTLHGLKRGATEANPIMAAIMKLMGDAWPLVKIAAAVLCWVQREELGWSTLVLADVVMAGVVAWNLRQLTKE